MVDLLPPGIAAILGQAKVDGLKPPTPTAGIITTEENTDQTSARPKAAANGTNAARALPCK